jgi:poly(hydroxyalkanoate) depolymerase family esterase
LRSLPEQKVMDMTPASLRAMLEAARLTDAGRLMEATALLQRILQNGAEAIPPADAVPSSRAGFDAGAYRPPSPGVLGGSHPLVPEALRGFIDQASRGEFQLPGGFAVPSPTERQTAVPDGAQFLEKRFSNQAGSRPYKLYVPNGYKGRAIPLIVMLHGCTQSPDDFAAGTGMNAAAEEHTCLVAYPGQTTAANRSKCWNWFSAADQHREQGEPSLIAGITRQIMSAYSVDRQRVYLAGLSAGGAAAAIMGTAYPDLYAAIGVHSGLACGSAGDLPSAFVAMRQGKGGAGRWPAGAPDAGEACRIIPAIVFHGDRDTTVHPCNGDEVIAQFTQAMPLKAEQEEGRVPGGHAYRRTLHAERNGRTVLEQWVIHGAGHAWSGGSPAGSFTDPRGPDATREMLRFFLEHPHPGLPSTHAGGP